MEKTSNEKFNDIDNEIENLKNAIERLDKEIDRTSAPIGTILAYGGSEPPPGWFFCDGSRLEKKDYENDLYKVINNTFGKPDKDSFNLPDLRGRFLRGVDTMGDQGDAKRDPDSSNRTAMFGGGNTGDKVGSVQGHLLGGHNHDNDGYGCLLRRQINGEKEAMGVNKGNLGSGPGKSVNLRWFNDIKASTGSETRPVNAYVNFIIRAR